MTNPKVDWGRAVIAGSVVGGIFWALAAFTIMANDGSSVAVTAVGVASVAVIAVGVFGYRSCGTNLRSLAVGAIIAPLTGAITIVTYLFGALLLQLVS